FFFFSSRRRHTRFSRDWSSDVCSSDLVVMVLIEQQFLYLVGLAGIKLDQLAARQVFPVVLRIREDKGHYAIVDNPDKFPRDPVEIGRASCRERVASVAGAGAGDGGARA